MASLAAINHTTFPHCEAHGRLSVSRDRRKAAFCACNDGFLYPLGANAVEENRYSLTGGDGGVLQKNALPRSVRNADAKKGGRWRQENRSWESKTGRNVKKKHGKRISSILEALEANPDIDDALNAWKGKLCAKEQSIVLHEQQNWEAAVKLFSWFKRQDNYAPNVFLYNIMFRTLGRGRRWDLLNSFWEDMLRDGIVPTNVTFSTLIDAYGKAGLKEDALLWYEAMERENVPPDEVTINTVVNLFKKFGQYDEAELFLSRWLLQKGTIHPDAVKNSAKVSGSFESLLSPSSRNCDTSLIAVQEDHDLLKGSVMPVCALRTTGGPGGAQGTDIPTELTASIPESRIKYAFEFYRPQNIDTYNTLIDMYGRAGRLYDASRAFEEMMSAGMNPDTVTFNTMIHICGHHDRLDEAEALFRKMEASCHEPDLATYNILIALYVKKGNIAAAEETWLKLKQAPHLPDQVTYRTLLSAFTAKGMISKAERLSEEMEEAGFPPDYFLLVEMVRMNLQAGLPMKSHAILERLMLFFRIGQSALRSCN
eukprot:c28615_g1_i2 orf=65-1681(+)